MRLEYFQLIDRSSTSISPTRTIRTEAHGPARQHDLRGPFPRLSADAGRAADRDAWRRPRAGWWWRCTNSSACRSWPRSRTPSCAPSSLPGSELDRSRPSSCTTAPAMPSPRPSITLRRQADLRRRHHVPRVPFPNAGSRQPTCASGAARHRPAEHGGAGAWLTRAREAWITGIGIVSCLGEGPDAHWQKLMRRRSRRADATTFAPYIVHPLAPMNFDAQIPKKGDQRQMEAWQRIGTYAAGLALDRAGVKGNADMLVAHGHDRRRRRRRARPRGRRRDPDRHAAAPPIRPPFSTSG